MRKSIPQIFSAIGHRAAAIAARHHNEVDPIEVAVTVQAVHSVQALRLQELLESDDGNFAHDVFGMLRHYDIENNRLRDSFRPRFSAPRQSL